MTDHPLALVLGGGGARAAYQVGFLRWLARRTPDLTFPILTGVSAGAINAAFLAQTGEALRHAVPALSALWSGITSDHVFRTDPGAFGRLAAQWILRFGTGGSRPASRPRGLVDTTPLRRFLTGALCADEGGIVGIGRNLARGTLRAVAITTTDMGSSHSTTWIQGGDVSEWERPTRRGVHATLSVDHVMASCAIPLFFPAIRIGDSWHADGAIRQITPLSPALKLGAGRILVVSTRYAAEDGDGGAARTDYPPPAQMIGVLFHAAFLDALDYDAMILARVNALIEGRPEAERHGFRKCRVLLLRPSRDLGSLTGPHEPRLPRLFRFFARGLGVNDPRNADLLSMLLFEPDYIRDLMDLGERDAEAQARKIEDFLAG